MVIWLTGKSGAGKTTIAHLIGQKIGGCVLDADIIRKTYWPELGYTKEDRDKSVFRMAMLAQLCMKISSRTMIVAAISPYREMRNKARELCSPNFIEVYVTCPDWLLQQRDTKGLYQQGIDQGPYEPPLNPEITIDTSTGKSTDAMWKIFKSLMLHLEENGNENSRTRSCL